MWKFAQFWLFGVYEHWGAFVLQEEHHEFRWFGGAGVSPDDVNILWPFVEGLTGRESHFFSAPHLHYDRAFQQINEPMCIKASFPALTRSLISL